LSSASDLIHTPARLRGRAWIAGRRKSAMRNDDGLDHHRGAPARSMRKRLRRKRRRSQQEPSNPRDCKQMPIRRHGARFRARDESRHPLGHELPKQKEHECVAVGSAHYCRVSGGRFTFVTLSGFPLLIFCPAPARLLPRIWAASDSQTLASASTAATLPTATDNSIH
jgi:hypothetical protein